MPSAILGHNVDNVDNGVDNDNVNEEDHLKSRPGAILGSQQDSCVALEMPILSDV